MANPLPVTITLTAESDDERGPVTGWRLRCGDWVVWWSVSRHAADTEGDAFVLEEAGSGKVVHVLAIDGDVDELAALLTVLQQQRNAERAGTARAGVGYAAYRGGEDR